MAKPEKFGHLHLVYHFTVPLKMSFELKCEGNSKFSIVPKFFTLFEIFHFLCARFLLSYTFKNKQNFLRIIKIPNIFIFPKIKKKNYLGKYFLILLMKKIIPQIASQCSYLHNFYLVFSSPIWYSAIYIIIYFWQFMSCFFSLLSHYSTSNSENNRHLFFN